MTRRTLLLPLLLAACGGGDAPSAPDAGPDADLGPAGEVVVETHIGGVIDIFPEPQPGDLIGGIDVVAVDVDGTTTVETTVEGRATFTLHAGASVTAIYPAGNESRDFAMTTYVGVEPGDTIAFGDAYYPISGPDASMEVTFPPIDGTRFFEVASTCSSQDVADDTTTAIFQWRHCAPPVEDVYLFAFAQSGLMYGVIEDVPFSDGGAVALDAWQSAPSFQLRATELPPDVEHVSLALDLVANGHAWFGGQVEGAPTEGAYSLTSDWPPVGDGLNVTVRFYSPRYSQWIRTRLPADASMHTFTEADWLPVVADGAFGLDTRVASFTAAEHPDVDAVTFDIEYRRVEDPFLVSQRWRVIAPPGARTVELPDLPDEYDAAEPRTTDEIGYAAAQLWDFSTDDGWDDARRRPPWDFGGTFEEDYLFEGGRISSGSLSGSNR